jgi:predicted dinucleotide-binding enzyme
MKAGILGSGAVGQVLARAFYNEGYDVQLGTDHADKEKIIQFKKDNPGIGVGSFKETAAFGEILVLAVAGAAVDEVITSAVPANFTNKIVIDTTNPIAAAPPVNGVLKYFTSMDESLMEKIQRQLPGAKLVKAFNSVGNAAMYKPVYKEGKPSMFICGNDEAAKKTVAGILSVFEWETEDMGKAEAARAIEPLCMLWCIPGFLSNQWTHAFKLLKT